MESEGRSGSLYDVGGGLLVVGGLVSVLGLSRVVTQRLPTEPEWSPFPPESQLLLGVLVVGGVLVGLGVAALRSERRHVGILLAGGIVLGPAAFVVALFLTLMPARLSSPLFFERLFVVDRPRPTPFGDAADPQFAVPGVLLASLLGLVAVVNALSLEGDGADVEVGSLPVVGAVAVAVVSLVALGYGVPDDAAVWVVLAVLGLSLGTVAVRRRPGGDADAPGPGQYAVGLGPVLALVSGLGAVVGVFSLGLAGWAGTFAVGVVALVGTLASVFTGDRRPTAGALSAAFVLAGAVLATAADAMLAGGALVVAGLAVGGGILWPAVGARL